MADSEDSPRISVKGVGTCFYVLPALAFFLVILFYPLSLLFVFKFVREYERAVLLRRGYLISYRLRGPGVFLILPCTDDIRVVDIRTTVLEVQEVEVTTKDGIGARLDTVVHYYISNPTLNVLRVADTGSSLTTLTRDLLGTVLASMKQRDLFSPSTIGEAVQSQMAETTGRWGVTIKQVDIKEVTLNSETQMPEVNERETIRRTLIELQLSAKEDSFTCSQVLQQTATTLEEIKATLKSSHEQATQDVQDNPKQAKQSKDSKDVLPTDEWLIKLYETLYASH